MNLKKVVNERSAKDELAVGISKNGVFNFNKYTVKELELNEKTGIDIYQDEAAADCWYFTIVPNGNIMLRIYDGRALGNSASIFKKIAKSTNNGTNKGIRCLIGNAFTHNGLTLYPLLIKKGNEIN